MTVFPSNLNCLQFNISLINLEHLCMKGNKIWCGKVIFPQSWNLTTAGNIDLSVSTKVFKTASSIAYCLLLLGQKHERRWPCVAFFLNFIPTWSAKPNRRYSDASSSASGTASKSTAFSCFVLHDNCKEITCSTVIANNNKIVCCVITPPVSQKKWKHTTQLLLSVHSYLRRIFLVCNWPSVSATTF